MDNASRFKNLVSVELGEFTSVNKMLELAETFHPVKKGVLKPFSSEPSEVLIILHTDGSSNIIVNLPDGFHLISLNMAGTIVLEGLLKEQPEGAMREAREDPASCFYALAEMTETDIVDAVVSKTLLEALRNQK